MLKSLLAASALSVALFAAPAFAQDADLSGVSMAVEQAQAAGLADAITGGEALTVFVPTNDALQAAPADALKGIMDDQSKLASVIQYYAIPGNVMAADAAAMTEATKVKTLNGEELTIQAVDGKVTLTGSGGGTATVVTPDIKVGNVVLHVIDGAPLPAM